jgi:hypothetical protein
LSFNPIIMKKNHFSFLILFLTIVLNGCKKSASPPPGTTNGGDPITHGQQINATNTGSSGSLTVHNGNYTISQAGAVVQNLEIFGEVRVTAPNVSIINCKIHGIGDYYPLLAYDHATKLLISHCTIVGSAPVGSSGDIAGIALEADAQIIRCDIGGPWIGDGIRPADSTVIEECYIHPLWNGRDAAGNSIDNTHNDGVQGEGSYSVQVIRCRIMVDSFSNAATGAGWNSAVFVDGLNGFNSSYWRIQDNYVAGGNYTIWMGPGTNNAITGNKVGRDFWSTGGMYGPTDLPVNAVNFTWSNNTWADTGQPLQQ